MYCCAHTLFDPAFLAHVLRACLGLRGYQIFGARNRTLSAHGRHKAMLWRISVGKGQLKSVYRDNPMGNVKPDSVPT